MGFRDWRPAATTLRDPSETVEKVSVITNHQSFPEIIDISLPLDARLAVWPGDTEFDYQLTWKKSAGASVNVGAARLSTHCGTHIDAPFHFDEEGKKVDDLGLAAFVGKAFVIHVPNRPNISRNDLSRDWQGATRLLLRTDAWSDPHIFPKQIPVIDRDVPDWLGSQGIVLLGLDVPSVDELDSTELPNHHALARNQIAILESLNLKGVEEGVYDLVAAPLKLIGADAAPVRALLMR
jgi:arylformamidase